MGQISPLVPLWLDLESLSGRLNVLKRQRDDREPAEDRKTTVEQIYQDIRLLRKRLAKGDAAELSRLDGSDHRPFVARVALALEQVNIKSGSLAVPQLDEADLSAWGIAAKEIENATEYVRALERVDDEFVRKTTPDPNRLQANRADRTVVRGSVSANFGKKQKPFELVCALIDAPQNGLSRASLIKTIWPSGAITDNALDQLKTKAEELLLPLAVEITSDYKLWKLCLR